MTDQHVFGSGRLTPELLRSATFDEVDGRYDAGEVRTFLERAASALDVLMSEDAALALRAEFSRNAEIAQQVLDAGQTASEQLRRQAGEDARRIIEETRVATSGLREAVEAELAESRAQAQAQVTAMRSGMIGDLRDLYDRIGASLYRFERAAGDDAVQDGGASGGATATEHAPAPELPAGVERRVAPVPPEASPIDYRNDRRAEEDSPPAAEAAPGVDATAPPEGVDLPEGAKPPAWQQLASDTPEPEPEPEASPEPEAAPASAAPTTPEVAPEPDPASAPEAPLAAAPLVDPFLVVEDEPLAPGEPLVDLSEVAQPGGGWLDALSDDADVPAATPAPAAPATEAAPPVDAAPPAADGGSWLEDAPAAEPTATPEAVPVAAVPAGPPPLEPTNDPAVLHDNALAEALIGGSPFGEEPASAAPPAPADAGVPVPFPSAAAGAPPAPATAPPAAPSADASADAVAVRQLILNSLSEGHPREAVEAYLRDHMGLMEPAVLVDAALNAQPPA